MSSHLYLQRLNQECPTCKEIIDHTLTCSLSGKQRCPKCGIEVDADEFKTVQPEPVDSTTYSIELDGRDESETVKKAYVMPCFGITVEASIDKASGQCYGCSLESDLIPDASEGIGRNFLSGHELALYTAAAEAVESMIMSHVMADIDIDMPEYVKGVETVVHAIRVPYGGAWD